MRLIDGDALIEVLKREEKENDEYGLTQRADGITDAIMDVIDAPTIEPQRMRGKWIPQGWNDTYCKCSCCDAVYVTAEIPYNYCPNCGSYNGGTDMRETE